MWIELASWISEICRENILYIIGHDVKKIKAKVSKLLCNYYNFRTLNLALFFIILFFTFIFYTFFLLT